MKWLRVLTLPDGTCVETALPTIDELERVSAHDHYRMRREDGSISVFSTMLEVVRYLSQHYDAEIRRLRDHDA